MIYKVDWTLKPISRAYLLHITPYVLYQVSLALKTVLTEYFLLIPL